jgi:hypothetical protein
MAERIKNKHQSEKPAGAEYTTKGRFRMPFLSGHHHRHLVHHARW